MQLSRYRTGVEGSSRAQKPHKYPWGGTCIASEKKGGASAFPGTGHPHLAAAQWVVAHVLSYTCKGVWQFLPLKGGHRGGKRDEGLCCGSFVPLPRIVEWFSRAGAYSQIPKFLPFERFKHLMAEHERQEFFSPRETLSVLSGAHASPGADAMTVGAGVALLP